MMSPLDDVAWQPHCVPHTHLTGGRPGTILGGGGEGYG